MDNERLHLGYEYVVALDISKFFQNTSREKVYNFFKHDMKNSSDVAEVLTDLCTIDLEKIDDVDENKIRYKMIKLKKNKKIIKDKREPKLKGYNQVINQINKE